MDDSASVDDAFSALVDTMWPKTDSAGDRLDYKTLKEAFDRVMRDHERIMWEHANVRCRPEYRKGTSPVQALYEQNYKSAVLDRNGRLVKVIDDGTA